MASTTEDQAAVKFPPLLSKKFDITGIKQDMLKWDKEWEAALASSTAADVLKEISHVMDDSFFTLDDLEFLHLDLRNVQEGAAQSLRKIFHEGHFNTIWLLLDASEQRRHILEGLEKASEAPTLWGQDSRALCPEVTVLNSYQRAGRVFESSDPALLPNSSDLPNPWWEQTSNDANKKKRSKSTKIVFEVATINRNKFIGFFLLFSLASILHDITHRSKGMKDVLNIVENTGAYFAYSLAQAKSSLRDKPLSRCENCTKTPEDIGQGVRFMVCSTCRLKLKFEVHYCSQFCQNEDWPVHKKACGKKKVSKGLSGTKGPCKGQRSPAAERQAKMLEADKDVDYFLFTANDVPVRFVIDDLGAKTVFWINRRMFMTQTADSGLKAMAEYMLKHMSGYPGLSRDIILKQLCAKHGSDSTEKVVEWERKTRERGIGTGTVIGSLSKDFMKIFGNAVSNW
ncbi:hypothetical protein BDR03DRAFT_999084 [Suillus americanus]|nr:hypothetical protein BDR03DRAFT_999084 [Suillus americanus]